jgi:hypothetical protein
MDHTKLPKDELQVQFHLIQVFTSVNIENKFLIQEFLDSYPSIISNQLFLINENVILKSIISNWFKSWKTLIISNLVIKLFRMAETIPEVNEPFKIFGKVFSFRKRF